MRLAWRISAVELLGLEVLRVLSGNRERAEKIREGETNGAGGKEGTRDGDLLV